MDLWRQEIEDAQDARRLSAPFSARLTGPDLDDGARSARFHNLRYRTRRRPNAPRLRLRAIRTERGAPPKRSGDGALADLGAGKGAHPTPAAKRRALAFGELPDTLGRPGRALEAITRRKPNQVPQNVRKTRSVV